MEICISALLAGKIAPLGERQASSGIDKKPVSGPVRLLRDGLECDEQGDRKVHGGPEKAVHHYPHDHYADWRKDVGDNPRLDASGAFGENISTTGLTEHNVAVGDRFRIGTALVEVSQGRQPCWKLNARFDVPDMAVRVQKTGRTGWYIVFLKKGSLLRTMRCCSSSGYHQNGRCNGSGICFTSICSTMISLLRWLRSHTLQTAGSVMLSAVSKIAR